MGRVVLIPSPPPKPEVILTNFFAEPLARIILRPLSALGTTGLFGLQNRISSLRNRDFDDDVEDMIRRIPTFASCKVSLYSSRAKVLPKLPKTQNDIALEGAWTETTAGETFVLNDDTNELGQRILIFSTDSNLRMLCDSNTMFGDGTFYSYPGFFYQQYTCMDT